MNPQVIECTQACTITVQHEITNPILAMGPEEGAKIGIAIALIWVIGWSFRMLIQAAKTGDGNEEN